MSDSYCESCEKTFHRKDLNEVELEVASGESFLFCDNCLKKLREENMSKNKSWEAHYRRELSAEEIPKPQIDEVLEESENIRGIKQKLKEMGYESEAERLEPLRGSSPPRRGRGEAAEQILSVMGKGDPLRFSQIQDSVEERFSRPISNRVLSYNLKKLRKKGDLKKEKGKWIKVSDRRPNKDEYYLDIAGSISERSPCIRRQFGAIVVKDDVIVSTGYNGPARGVVNCLEVGCLKDELDVPSYEGYRHCPAVHAEENAVINAARHGAPILGGKLYLQGKDYETGEYCKGKPCDRCRRVLINAGIEEVITRKAEGNIERYDVGEWISEDTEEYLEKLEKRTENR